MTGLSLSNSRDFDGFEKRPYTQLKAYISGWFLGMKMQPEVGHQLKRDVVIMTGFCIRKNHFWIWNKNHDKKWFQLNHSYE